MDTLYYDDITIPSNGSYDIFVLKLDENGDCIWSLSAGNNHPSGDYSRSITRSPDGSLYITGRFYEYTYFGNEYVMSYGSADMFLAKIMEEPVSVIYHKTERQIVIYPNPAKNICNIIFQGGDIQKAMLVGLDGKPVLINEGCNINKINVSEIPPGVYVLRLYSENSIFFEKIIIL
ncbi:MAG: T9SS type A sorting domain-containing protein [Bacteroidia bacterium]|nr:T9SS type A sorting domain-containing protein [Bacteroidia bacterium]